MSERPKDEGKAAALSHVRIVEMGGMPAAYCSGYLAGFGADVVKVEPPGGDPNRWLPPFAGGIPDLERSLPFLNANLNKRSIVIDVSAEDDRSIFETLLARADILIEATPVGYLRSIGLGDEYLDQINRQLVHVALTPFGQSGPYSRYTGDDIVVAAMSGLMATQGDDTKPPVVPPCQISYQLAAIQGAYLALAALRHRRRSGRGQRVDLSLQEALTFTTTSAIARYSQRNEIVRRQGVFPHGGGANIFKCKDGRYVYLAAFLVNHWKTLTRDWMEDPVLSRPEWDVSQFRNDNSDLVQIRLAEFIARFESTDFVTQAQRRGLTCGPVNTVDEFVESEHMGDRAWLQEINHPVIGKYRAPGPPCLMSLTPYRISRSAPLLDQHRDEILEELALAGERFPAALTAAAQSQSGNPGPSSPMLDGVRVLDLTRAVAGPTGTMFLGFYGAEVLKIESADLMVDRDPTSPLYPDLNRNKKSCTIDLRQADGKDLLKRLVELSDILVDNFSATVMRRLGLSYEEMSKVKKDLIQIGMPGMGSSGPLSWWVTYGNQLQAYTGLTRLWGYPDSPMEAHAKLFIPDYCGASFLAFAALVAIEYRDISGYGQYVEIAQVDAQAALLGPAILDFTVNGKVWDSVGYQEPLNAGMVLSGCYPCRYPDTWIVISCRQEEDWHRLTAVLGRPTWATNFGFEERANRVTSRAELDAHLSEWTRAFTPYQLLWLLQKAGVSVGIVMNGEQLYLDPHLRARGHIVEVDEPPWGRLAHSGLPGVPSLSVASAGGPAPWIGDHNDYVFGKVLGLRPEEVRALHASGAIR